MIRSEINAAVDAAIRFFHAMRFGLPEYAFWGPAQWRAKAADYREVLELGLGWDVTDFGSDDLRNVGRTIFTLRNGRAGDTRYPKPYAQKVMYMREGQKSAIHYHHSKMEDIHNQGGGTILIRLWAAGSNGEREDRGLALSVSGRRVEVGAGEAARLAPGEWICVPPLTYHQFWAEAGSGDVLSVEISSVCDDRGDNFFLDGAVRFPPIEEDEPAQYVLCCDYPRLAGR